ncbi:hypothetical protein PFISCL1PPCAC_14530, partial [Pristionchus fissidentatus]
IKQNFQQFLTGLSKVLYWLSSFVSDCWTLTIYYIAMIIFCLIFNVLRDRLLELTPLFILVMLVSLFKIYIIQRIFTSKILAENFASLVLLIEYIALGVLFLINQFYKKGEKFKFNISLDYPALLDPQVTVMAYMTSAFENEWTAFVVLLGQLSLFFILFCL